MPPRFQTLPPAQTLSAREAMQSFYCQLCSKGYSRMNDYEAHLSSYDHTHRQRLRDMKAMVKGDTSRARKAEAKAEGIISIKLGGDSSTASGSGAFKKGGFKKAAFAPIGAPKPDSSAQMSGEEEVGGKEGTPRPPGFASIGTNAAADSNPRESDTEDEGYQVYDPQFPTD